MCLLPRLAVFLGESCKVTSSVKLRETLPARAGCRNTIGWIAACALCQREVIRFLRQRNRVAGAIGQPLIFWLLFSAGFADFFRLSADATKYSFQRYYFPGSLILTLLFTAIFATISIIEDRHEGILQSVLVSPVPRLAVLSGKVLGGTIIAGIQGVLFLILALTVGIELGPSKFLHATVLLFAVSFALTAIGTAIAWRMESSQGFHAIMTVFLIPMWLLSGAFFPIPPLTDSSTLNQIAMHWVMKCNPLSYCVAGLHRVLFDGPMSSELFVPSLSICWTVILGFCTTAMFVAWRISSGRTRGDLL
jgi:ABC-2 type transport system permease protein